MTLRVAPRYTTAAPYGSPKAPVRHITVARTAALHATAHRREPPLGQEP
ncbi:hypothetical protein [Mobiluncus mulieris]|nr:hypothetical protein [Mobiluncus mulieris]NMW74239.1 hypothetical protein [Mobiluncus mulieris]NMX18800.1 hypothetical protein [Mobiluncus mulieris]